MPAEVSGAYKHGSRRHGEVAGTGNAGRPGEMADAGRYIVAGQKRWQEPVAVVDQER